MSVCDDCPKQVECLFEGWEPCSKVVAWEALSVGDKNPNYKSKGTASTWAGQKKRDTSLRNARIGRGTPK